MKLNVSSMLPDHFETILAHLLEHCHIYYTEH
jgi:hypothetical protein